MGLRVMAITLKPIEIFYGILSGPEFIKLFSAIVGILTFMSGKNSILGLSGPKKGEFLAIFFTYEHLKFHAQLS